MTLAIVSQSCNSDLLSCLFKPKRFHRASVPLRPPPHVSKRICSAERKPESCNHRNCCTFPSLSTVAPSLCSEAQGFVQQSGALPSVDGAGPGSRMGLRMRVQQWCLTGPRLNCEASSISCSMLSQLWVSQLLVPPRAPVLLRNGIQGHS